MHAQVETNREKSWFVNALGEVPAFAGSLLKNFFLVLVIGGSLSLLTAVVVYFSGGSGPLWNWLAAGTSLIGSFFITILSALKLSIVISISELVKAKALGHLVLDALFAELLGVTTENPQGNIEVTQALHGMPVTQAEARLKEAGRALLQNRPTLPVPKLAAWLVNKAQQLLVWATVRVVISYGTRNKSRTDSIDLLAVRTNLANNVDGLLISRIRQGAIRLVLWVVTLFLLGCWGMVNALQVFFGP